ncbi:Uncharacterised protein [Stenotrophomonas maltophilia]|nr:Uncharacterised protein [Stenotrophomonas maltophilia]
MDRKLLDLLVSPDTRQPLSLLDGKGLEALNKAISAGAVNKADGNPLGAAAARSAGHPRPQAGLPR